MFLVAGFLLLVKIVSKQQAASDQQQV